MSKRKELSHARFRYRMHRDNMDGCLRDLQRKREAIHSSLLSLEEACKGYITAVEELQALTTKKKEPVDGPVQQTPPKII